MISNLIPKTFSDIKLDQLFPFLGNGWSSFFSLFVSSWSVAKGKPSAASVLVADKVSSFHLGSRLCENGNSGAYRSCQLMTCFD